MCIYVCALVKFTDIVTEFHNVILRTELHWLGLMLRELAFF